MRRPTLSLLGLSALLLTGCGVQKDASYDDANALRQAVEDTGVECGDDEQSAGKVPGTTTVMCDVNMMLTVLGREESVQDITDALEQLDVSYLRGGNWIVASGYLGRLEEIQEGIGGDLTRVS